MGALTTLPPLHGDVGGPQFANYGDTGFGPIGGYPQLPELGAPTLPQVGVAPVAPNNGVKFENPLLNSAASAINFVAPKNSSILAAIKALTLEDIIFIVIGLVLLIAGVFSFKSAQTVIKEGGKAAAGAVVAA